ncbi:MAG: 50S ribosomal protein L18 [Candidatus Gottesmanbacteria bacterium]
MTRLRLSVYKSNKHIYSQIIDDKKGETLVSSSDLGGTNKSDGLKKTDRAREIGKNLAKKALEKKIHEVVFNRGKFRYHGRVKALADGAREGGLKF